MAKALKVIGIAVAVIGVGLATAGFGAVAFTGIVTATISTTALIAAGAVLEVGASLLARKTATTTSMTDRLTADIDPRAPRKTAYGRTALATDVRYEEWNGPNQEYCDWIICLAAHKIESLDEIWINDQQAWTLAGGRAAAFRDYFGVIDIVLEGSPTNTLSFASGKWNNTARLTGCAYVHVSFRVTGVNSKATSPFSGGLPSRITAIGRGGMMFDPRRDSTVPGGSGPMLAGDQSTWRYTASDGTDLGPNIPLMILRELLGWSITNPSTGARRVSVGCGMAPRRIDMSTFITAANIADELANVSAGGTEPKFHGGALLSESDDFHTRLDMLCTACNGRLRDVNGKLGLFIMHDDLAAAATDDGLDDDDVIGAFTWESDPSLDQSVNAVRGKYTDPTSTSLYQMIDYPDVTLTSPDGIDRVLTLDLGVVQSAAMAQRIAKQTLERRQYQRTFTAPFDIRAWKYQVGDVVPFTFSPLSFDRRLLRVSAQELRQDGTCNMSLTDENEAMYAWDADDAPPVTAAEAIVYDPTKSPLVLAIADAASSADWSLVVDDGGKPTNYADKTLLNTAAGITGQGAFATLSSAGYGSPFLTGFNILATLPNISFGSAFLLEGFGGAVASLSAFKTALGVASAIFGQSALATAGFGLNVAGAIDAVHIDNFGVGRLSSFWPAQAGADVTGYNTAAAFSGQGAFATVSYVDLSNGAYFAYSARFAASEYGGQWFSAGNVAWAYGTGGTVQDLKPGEAGANVTEWRNAAGFAGQGILATKNQAGTSDVVTNAITATHCIESKTGGAEVTITITSADIPAGQSTIAVKVTGCQNTLRTTYFDLGYINGADFGSYTGTSYYTDRDGDLQEYSYTGWSTVGNLAFAQPPSGGVFSYTATIELGPGTYTFAMYNHGDSAGAGAANVRQQSVSVELFKNG